MANEALSARTDGDIVNEIITLSIKQKPLTEDGPVEKCNAIIKRIMKLNEELKRRPGDGRLLLIPYLEHPNVQVRLNAGRALLGIAAGRARPVIEAIADGKEAPFYLHAGMTLHMLDSGIIHPK